MAAMALVTTDTPGMNALLPMFMATAMPIAMRKRTTSTMDEHIMTRIKVRRDTPAIMMKFMLSGSRFVEAVSTVTSLPYLLLMVSATVSGDASGSRMN